MGLFQKRGRKRRGKRTNHSEYGLSVTKVERLVKSLWMKLGVNLA